MRTAYITHPDMLRHEPGDWHPESPARLQAINDRLISTGVMKLLGHLEAPEVDRKQLERVHHSAYLDELERQSPRSGRIAIDPDTWMSPGSLSAARRAAGAGVLAVDRVMAGEYENAFCAVRPPGHHAEPDAAMGFCFYNNVAVAAAHALAAHGLERVAILDFDVHHGNGTEAIFLNDPRVLYCSSYQHPFYPNLPTHDRPNLVHTPLPAGADGPAFAEAVERSWLPAVNAFRPQLLLVSAGFDGHRDDDMASLALTEGDYAWITGVIRDLAAKHADDRVVSMLEGGYELDALARSAVTHIRGLMGI